MPDIEYSGFGYINTMPVDALATLGAKASTTMVLAVQDRQHVWLSQS